MQTEEIKAMLDQTQQTLFGLSIVEDIFSQPRALTEEQSKQLYAVAYVNYGQGKYLEAAKMFHFLLREDFFEKKYYQAFAGCMFMLENYEAAAKAYAFAWMLDCRDAVPLFYAGRCFIALKKHREARFFLREFLKDTEKSETEQKLREQAKVLLKTIRKTPATAITLKK
jgi:type III secretion system low calcium response chaperone LcrH/SycD